MNIFVYFNEHFAGFDNMMHSLQMATIEQKRREIQDNLTLDEDLLSELQSRDVISSETAETIRCMRVNVHKNQFFIQAIHYMTIRSFNTFLDVLRCSRQRHVASLCEISPQTIGKSLSVLKSYLI